MATRKPTRSRRPASPVYILGWEQRSGQVFVYNYPTLFSSRAQAIAIARNSHIRKGGSVKVFKLVAETHVDLLDVQVREYL